MKYYTMIGGMARVYHDTLDDAKAYCDMHYYSDFANGKNLQVIFTDLGKKIPSAIERNLYVTGGDPIGMVRRTKWYAV